LLSQVYSYKVYNRNGFLTLHPDSGQLVLDADKTLAVLDDFSDCFLRLLACMDNDDGPVRAN
jgi:hypothetical protein